MLCIWLRRHKTSISFIFKLFKIELFFANKGNLLLKLKHIGNVVWSFHKKIMFNNFSSSVLYILLNKYFCCSLQKAGLILTCCREYLYISVIWGYEMLLLKLISETLMKWLSEQFMSLLRLHVWFSVCVCVCVCVCGVKENVRLSSIHTEIWPRNVS